MILKHECTFKYLLVLLALIIELLTTSFISKMMRNFKYVGVTYTFIFKDLGTE